ncbi:Gfo/Idh/MocA family protein [Jeotgalibaca porci]|uniref:Gfo/Idh/MocA family protein n=2 Tax=Jeotgalibaca porci TaxID=1868793 RepID=UPI00359F1DBD
MKEVIWGMIGCGDVTEKKTGPGLYKAEGSQLKGVFNRTTKRAEDWVERHGHGQVYVTVEEMLADSAITAVYIATPPESHYNYAIQALKAGKAVLIEKPMAIRYEECLEIIMLSEKLNVPVFVNFYRRSLPKIQFIKTSLEEGLIGKPLTVDIRHFRKPEASDYEQPLPWRLQLEAGGGKALDTQVHVLDYLSYFFGHLTHLSGQALNNGGLYPVEDTTVATLQFATGIIGTATWCYVAGYELDEVTITGTSGKMVFSGTGITDVTLNDTVHEMMDPEHVGLAFIQAVVDELNGKSKSPADVVGAALVTHWFEKLLSN